MSLQEPILLSAASLLIGAAFSAMHAALVDVASVGLEELAAKRGTPAQRRRVERILRDLPGHARAVALPRLLFNLMVPVGLSFVAAALAGRADGTPTLADALIAVGVSAVLLWVSAVAMPDAVARHAAERCVLLASRVIRSAHLIQAPLAPVARALDRGIESLVGKKPEEKTAEAEAELLSVIDEVEREGNLDQTEREMIEAAVEFGSLTVEQVMTPRTEIEALELTSNFGQITAFVRKARHSRIPVYRGTLDEVVGIFYVKDLLRWLAGEHSPAARGFDLKAILRPAIFVPETKTIRELLHELVNKKVHIAVVADEYGGTAGLITLEDIVEEVFGEIQDEYEKPEDEPPKIEIRAIEPAPVGERIGAAADGSTPQTGKNGHSAAGDATPGAVVALGNGAGGGNGVNGGSGATGQSAGAIADADARSYIYDVNAALEPYGVHLPEGDDYDTLGGFVMTHMGRIPAVGEGFQHGTMQVTVLEATPMRVVRVRLQVRPGDEPPERAGVERAATRPEAPEVSVGVAAERRG